jgi:hypothetical protein
MPEPVASPASETLVYTSEVAIARHGGLDRTATMPAGEQVALGAHSGIAEHYGLPSGSYTPTSATLDYLVAAAGG